MKLEDLECVSENVNLDEYIEFREMVKKHMEHPEWLGDFSKEELSQVVKTDGKIWVFSLKGESVCSMMMIPATKRNLNKFELDFEPSDVVDYGPMFVNPKYWGNKLQYQMLLMIDSYCQDLGYIYAIGTIHPDNSYSIHNLLKDGFTFHKSKDFTRGIRNIYFKKIK